MLVSEPRRPRVSSTEMSKKMVGRKLIRLSQIKEKMAVEKLEEIDWVTFGVILKKVTPQSTNSVSHVSELLSSLLRQGT